MGVLLFIIAAIVLISTVGAVGSAIGASLGAVSSGVPVIVMIVGIVIFGGVLKEYVKSKKNVSNASRRDMEEIKNRISNIETDIADIKEQIADFIINQI